ncbi:helix-turn-helix domain-containing protein [Mediterraneibacter gnavus]|uniref:helix-turn-helix domain-containing protein n=1 Tax=Mediterraneibacter gnavus TaxID=33038 RepID=UPI00367070F9
MKFQRIEDLRVDNDITIKEISSVLDLHRDVYARYEKGIRQFPVDIIIKLAKYYNCTTDYLLGISDKKETYKGDK